MNNALLSSAFVLSFMSGSAFANGTQTQPVDWLNFNASQGDIPANAGGWFHRDPGQSGCAGWGPDQSALCLGNSARLHWYYNGHNSDHIGWLRYGAMMATQDIRQTGHSLTFMATGGAMRDPISKSITEHGSPIKSLSRLLLAEQLPKSGDYSDVVLPGSIPVYYKNTSNTDTIPAFKGKNRLTQWVWLPADPERRVRHSRHAASSHRPDKTVAWYPFLDDSKGGHYYHHITNRAAGGWIMAQWDAHPTHHNGGPYPPNHAFTEGGRDAPLDGRGYFSRITAFSMVYHTASNAKSPYRVTTDDWALFYQPDENEETIASLAIGFDPEFQDFDISFEDKYRCSACHAQYELWVSTSPITLNSLHLAKRVTLVENYFIEDDNHEGLIIKPNPHYNQIWARFKLPEDLLKRHLDENTPLFFAVRDVSSRGAISDHADNEIVMLEDGSQSARTSLLKTLRYAPANQSQAVQATIQAESQLRGTVGERVSVQLTSSVFKAGWSWVIEPNAAASALLTEQKQATTLEISSAVAGEHRVSVRLRDNDGHTRDRHTVTLITREADCRQLTQCPHYTLVSYGKSVETHDKPSPQWHTVIRDVYTNAVSEGGMGIVVGSNGGYQFAGIKGDTFILGPHDVLTFTVKNATSTTWNIGPRLSLSSEERVNVTPSAWITLPARIIEPGQSVRFEVPASQLPAQTFNLININLPINSQNILLKDIGLYSDKSMLCQGCGATLIDFYHNEGKHVMPFSDWQTPLKDVYTGKVGSRGSGIVIGSNGSYNYQGVRGNIPLPAGANHIVLRWQNHSDQSFTFSPRISFDDPDRVHFGEIGTWTLLDAITLGPGESMLQYAPLPEHPVTLVNISMNVNQHKLISLTKIALD